MASRKTFSESKILRTEPDVGKEAIIEVRDASTKAVTRYPTHPSGLKLCS
jgi:hypothetical protein